MGTKHIFILLFMVAAIWACDKTHSEDNVKFSDEDFVEVLIAAGVDQNNDGVITFQEAERVNKLEIIGVAINELGGLEAFTNLDSLILKMLPLEQMDLSANPGLKYLECSICDLKIIDLSRNKRLEEISCETNQIETLLLPESDVLKILRCGYNRIQALDLSGSPALTSLGCNNNLLVSLNLSNNLHLTRMISCGNQLTELDVSVNTKITTLGIDNMPSLTEVCVWTLPFPPDGVRVLMDYSPNVVFVKSCTKQITYQ